MRWLLALALVAGCTSATIVPSETKDLLRWIELNSDYAVEYNNPPIIRYVANDQMAPNSVQTATGGVIVALYFDRKNEIWLNRDAWQIMPDYHKPSVLLHELVHHVQAQNNNFHNNCDKEIEARELQIKFLQDYGQDASRVNMKYGHQFKAQCINIQKRR